MEEAFDLLVGIDWGFSNHQVCVLDICGKIKGQRSFEHSGQSLTDLCDWLLTFTQKEAGRVAIAIEVPYGPLVETLLDRGFAVFFIHPKQLDRFRDRFSASGAKDDRRDARVGADALRTDRTHLRRLSMRDSITIRLGEWQRILAEVTEESLVLTNRLRSHLWRYFPAFLEVAYDLSLNWISALWALIPNPAAATTATLEDVAKLLGGSHPVRRFDAQAVLTILRKPAPIVASGTVEAAEAHCRLLFERLQLVLKQQKEARRAVDVLLAEWDDAHPPVPSASETPGGSPRPGDAEILRSLPGLGRVVLATLLSEAGELVKNRDYQALRLLAGVAPVTRQSGKMRQVLRRFACSRPLRRAVHHWARVASTIDKTSIVRYQALRKAGHSNGRALRTVGDRLLAVACATLKNGTLFDPEKGKTTPA